MICEKKSYSETQWPTPSFLEQLKKPNNSADWAKNRFNYLHSAQGLGDLIKEHPELVDSTLKSSLLDILKTKNPELDGARMYLRKFLPRELTKELDEQVMQAQSHPSNSDPCAVVNRIADHFSKSLEKGWNLTPDAYYTSENTAPFSLAVNSLVGEFLVEARATGHEIPHLKERLNTLMTQSENKGTKEKSRETKDEILSNLESAGVSKDAIQSAKDFLNKAGDFTESGSEKLPPSGSAIFATINMGRLLNSIQGTDLIENQEEFNKLRARIDDRLKQVVQNRDRLMHEEGAGNSRFATYHFSAAAQSFSKNPKDVGSASNLATAILAEERKINLNQ